MNQIIFSGKKMRYNKAQKSLAMKELMRNEKIAEAFSKRSDQDTLYKAMKEKAKEGAASLSKEEMKEALSELRHIVNDKKVKTIAKELFHSSKLPPGRKALIKLRSTFKSSPSIGPRVGNSTSPRMMPRRTPSLPSTSNSSPSLSMRLPH